MLKSSPNFWIKINNNYFCYIYVFVLNLILQVGKYFFLEYALKSII